MVAHGCEVCGGDIGSGQIELVIDAVEASVADEGEHKVIFRSGLAG